MVDLSRIPTKNITPQESNSSSLEEELARVNKEIYERNVELSIHNRTLSILSKIYDIINTALGLQPTAEKLINAIVQELKFQKGFIALIDYKAKILHSVAVSDLNKTHASYLKKYKHPFINLRIPLKNRNNICIISTIQKQQRMTNILFDILTPIVTEEESEGIAEKLHIQTSVLYPIVFGGKALGVLCLCLDKHVGALTRFERETLKELMELVSIAIERAKIYADLKKANKRLKELDFLKDEFVSIASHELRTPMTAIKSYLWMAINKSPQKLEQPLKKYLDISYKSTERLIHLVNDMLTVSRIERGKVEIKRLPFDIAETLQMVYEELKITAQEKHIDFTLEKNKAETYKIVGDSIKLREVFQNLVGNALKFTPENGKITIRILMNKKCVEISVSDTGSGIPKSEQKKLFKKFSKIDYSYSKHSSQPGTGLGLYISKQIVSLHNGDITVQSEADKGSTFTVILPQSKIT
ncbi:MAG: GAF domain-containing sensor histidine kinase [Candidatus Roizmanbacteria bacterium]|nr:GAF domain-containing sensor histidine kinase [Candidatus Roizmanbacteria bacterium]